LLHQFTPPGGSLSVSAPSRRALLRDPGHFIALGAGTGLARRAPGTWGSLLGVLLYLPLADLPRAAALAVAASLFVLGIGLAGRTARALGESDPGAVTVDEVVACYLTLSFCSGSIYSIVLGFALFRACDIVKPWPIGWLDRHVKGGLGIMLDDLAAAGYAIGLLKIIEYFSLAYIINQ